MAILKVCKQISNWLHKSIINYDFDYFQFMKDYIYNFLFANEIVITKFLFDYNYIYIMITNILLYYNYEIIRLQIVFPKFNVCILILFLFHMHFFIYLYMIFMFHNYLWMKNIITIFVIKAWEASKIIWVNLPNWGLC